MTSKQHVTFEEIDQQINALNFSALHAPALTSTNAGRIDRALRIYRGIRPILIGLNLVPLIPQRWRDALQIFIAALDELTSTLPAGQNGDFKAGKDL